MKKIAVIFTALCIFYSISAQVDSSKLILNNTETGISNYKTWVSVFNAPYHLKGELYQINDSSLVLLNSFVRQNHLSDKDAFSVLNFNAIDEISLRSKKSTVNGAIMGAVFGLVIGVTIGLLSGDDPPPPPNSFYSISLTAGQKAFFLAIPTTLGGALIGAMLGSIKFTIPIKGDMENFKKNKTRLKQYAINH